MTENRFPYKKSTWAPSEPERQRRWFEALERTGPENVRARLAQVPTGTGSAATIPVGTEMSIALGFAQEWLAWHDRRKSEREAGFRSDQIFWTRWAALAASLAALAAAVGWGL